MATQATLEAHDLVRYLPPMSKEEYESLKCDIQANGQIEPILTYEGKTLDGDNRVRACHDLGIEPWVEPWKGKGDPLTFVLSKNVQRRHLSSSQRAMLAVKIEPVLKKQAKERQRAGGGSKKKVMATIPEAPEHRVKGPARDEAARLFGTNPRYVDYAKELSSADAGLAEQVKEGTLTLPEAMKQLHAREQPNVKVEDSSVCSVEPPAQPSTEENGAATSMLNEPESTPLTKAGVRASARQATDSEQEFKDLLFAFKGATDQLQRHEEPLQEQIHDLNPVSRKALATVLRKTRDCVDRMLAVLQGDQTSAAPSEN